MLGTTLRLAVYGSILNLGLSFAGKTEGFWATKVCFSCHLSSTPCPLPQGSTGCCLAFLVSSSLTVTCGEHSAPSHLALNRKVLGMDTDQA